MPHWLEGLLGSLEPQDDRVPHALLLHGQAGIGKRALGRALSRSLLCEAAGPARRPGGCGGCPACLWFDQGNHPDFRKVVPEAVAAAEGLDLPDDSVDGADDAAPEATGSRSKRAPSREIRVDQIRALQSFVSMATHRGRFRVVLAYPLEALNDIGANALLKMLEEPPPRTVFVLIADHLGRIPPTILSRCRKVLVATPSPAIAAAWLAERQVDDPAAMLALAGGAPLTALAFAQDDAAVAAHRDLVGFLARPGIEAAMAAAEAFGRAPAGPPVRWLQQWLADCVARRLTGRIRYHPAHSATIDRLAGAARLDTLMALTERVDGVRRTIDHPLNTRLLLESLFSAYADAMVPARPSAALHAHRPTP